MIIVVGLLLSIFILFIVAIAGITIYALIQYVFESIFLYKIMKNKNNKGQVSVWIPFYNKVLLGKIAGKELIGWFVFVFHVIIVTLLVLFCFMYNHVDNSLCEIVLISIALLVIVNFILNMVMFHSIIKRVTVKYGDLIVVLNVLTLGLFRSIILFLVRDNDNILSSGR